MAKRKTKRRRRNTPAVAFNPPRRRGHRRRRNPPGATHRRRTYRRNPVGLSVRGVTSAAMQGVKDAGGILAGEAVAGLAETYIPGITPGTTKSAAVAGVAGVVGGVVAMRFVGRRTGEMMIAGSIAKLVRRFVKAQNVPVLSAALGDYGLPLASGYDSLGSYSSGALPPGTGMDSGITGDSSLAEIYGF